MSETNENIYQIDLDLLKEAETVFRQTAEKMNENMENMKTMVAGTEDIYQGVDAETLRSGVTDFVNTGMTALQEKTAGTARILKEAYTDYGFCKTYCEHFEDVLDGQANGATFGESVSGKMKDDLDGIEEIREKCKSVCEETEEIRKGLIVIENMLANLPVGGFDVTPYTQAIREQTYVVDRLDDYRIGLGKYAAMAENANDRTKEKLTALAQEYETIRETHAEIPEKETVDEEIWKQEIENYWNRKDGYFEEGWWLDEEKKQEAINMLLLESALSESGDGEEAGYDLLAHYTGTEIGSPKRYALQIMFQLEPIDGDDGIVLNNIAGACLREGIDLAGNGWIIPQEIMQKHMIEHRKLQVQSDEDEKRLVSFMLNFTPVLGEGKAVIEAIAGRDLLTGEELSVGERVIGLAAGFSDVVYYLKGVKGARYTDDVIDAVGDVHKSGTSTSRPTWRQSELDATTDFPDYDAQKSFINGEEVPYGTKGSVRPDYYKDGFSVDIKNYNVESASGRSNLARNIEKQYYQRIENLPDGTKQSVMIDVRGQNVSDETLGALYDDIMRRTNNGVEILFKMD